MNWKIKLTALAAALAVFAAGCGAGTAPVDPPAETPAEQTETLPAPAETEELSITEAATGLSPDEIVASVEGNEAPAELLTYYVGYITGYLNEMWLDYGQGALDMDEVLSDGTTAADYVRTEALTLLKQQLVLENMAERYGLRLSAEDEAELAEQKASDILEYGEAGFREELHSLGLSEAGYDRVVRMGYLYRAFDAACVTEGSELYASEDALADYAAEQGYITADHILVMTVDPESREPLEDAVVAEKRALAEDLLWRLRDSRDPVALFKTLADEYSEDTGRAANPDGYTFAEGTMVDEFDAAARALAENEYSDIVESVYGYHIILRKPLDRAAAADAVRDAYGDRRFLDAVDAAEMTVSDAAQTFDTAAVYDAILAAHGTDAAESAQENPFAPK